MTTIGLCVLVKNEEKVIARCLESVKPLISHWTIVDSQSSDRTEEIVRAELSGIPGTFHQLEWKGHGGTRTDALALARRHTDYTLMIDADDSLEMTGDVGELTSDGYTVDLRDEGQPIHYSRVQLFKNTKPWRYEGRHHEFPICDETVTVTHHPHLRMLSRRDGARASDPKKYETAALELEMELRQDPKNARNAFYCAQSWRDAHDNEKALYWYERRALMAGWDEETYVALHEAARCKERLGRNPDDVHLAYLRAYEARPPRVEALADLVRYLRLHNRIWMAYPYALRAATAPRPSDSLFVSNDCYDWVARDELALCLYTEGKLESAAEIWSSLLLLDSLPAIQRERIQKNIEYCAHA